MSYKEEISIERNRYNTGENYVTVLPPSNNNESNNTDKQILSKILSGNEKSDYTDTIKMMDGANEKTSGIDRSFSLLIRVIPYSIVWLILSVGISFVAEMSGGFTLILFAVLTAYTYGFLDLQERKFSTNGVEIHKINTLSKLRIKEMKHNQELRKMAVETSLRILERKNDGK